MRLMMLGASLAQLPGIQTAKKMNISVVTCDNLVQSVGHALADHVAHASTFDPEGVCRAAREYAIDGIMTMGSDQPVLTAAIVAQELGLPSALDVPTARAVTDKRVMKRLFSQLGIPTVPYLIFRYKKGKPACVPPSSSADDTVKSHPGEQADGLDSLSYPVVVKPVDSQGQRGIYLLDTPDAVMARFNDVLAFSRADEILVESYYPSDEVTVSGWVRNDRTTILSITDRVTFPAREQLGVCLSHELPSKHLAEHGEALIALTHDIVAGFGIHNGPIYFQYLIGAEGIKVNEVACRIGGAFESQFLPPITGFDLTRVQVQTAVGLEPDPAEWAALDRFDVRTDQHFLSVQLFFAEPCTIGSLTSLSDLLACEGVMDAGYHKMPGQTIPIVRDATARVGYCIVTGDSRLQVESRLDRLYQVLEVRDLDGSNRIVHRSRMGEMA